MDILIISALIIVFLIILIADYYDLRYGIIPNKISVFLLVYGILLNIGLSIIVKNINYFFYSIILMSFVFIISFILWKISFWGGGDLKLFTSMSLSLSFFDVLDKFSNADFLGNFMIFNQTSFYPKIFAVLLNSIMLSFPIILLILIFRLYKNHKLNLLYLIFANPNYLIKELSTKTLYINDLKEGMILADYYFNNNFLFNLINKNEINQNDLINCNEEIIDLNYQSNENEKYEETIANKRFDTRIDHVMENLSKTNLKAYSEKNSNFYILKTNTMAGLSSEDVNLLNYFYRLNLIENPYFKVKIGIPFMPSLTAAYLIFLIFGDLLYLISSFI